jgi:hypothetical protein
MLASQVTLRRPVSLVILIEDMRLAFSG